MFSRDAAHKLKSITDQFPVIGLLGPRQSGKTTLSQELFPDYAYVSLEDLDVRNRATLDPRTFLASFLGAKGVIFDEIQHVPDLLSYIQTTVDREKKMGFFVITGSQNLLLNQVTQTLAGRIFILRLLPLSVHEMVANNILPKTPEQAMFYGGYPPLFVRLIDPVDWYNGYVRTYLERDVRQLKNITDLSQFQRFMKLCAGRIGQLLNLTSLSNDCGISVNTAKAWISILETSYIIFLVHPHYKNFSKRLIKAPKLYFYDTGVACRLLEMESEQDLFTHYLRGGLFESFMMSSIAKHFYNLGRTPSIYFWRDKTGNEIDCIIEKAHVLTPIEIKAGRTVNSDFFDSLEYWRNLAQKEASPRSLVLYAGDENQGWTKAQVVSWRSVEDFL